MQSLQDTLVNNASMLNRLRSEYDYTSHIMPDSVENVESTDIEMPSLGHGDAIGDFFGGIFQWLSEVPPLVWYMLLAVLLAVLLTMLYRVWHRSHSLPTDELDGDVQGEDIYLIDDYDQAIAEAEREKQWAEVIRLVYLQTLRRLNDTQRVAWQPFKTPMNYVSECNDEHFLQLTLLYLRVRFGRYEATAHMVAQSRQWQSLILEKGGEHEMD